MVRSKEMKTLPEAIASNASLKRFIAIWNLQSEQSDLVSFDIEALKKRYWNWNVFWFHYSSRIWCGSSGALVAAIYDKYAQTKSRFSRTLLAKNYYS
jgi:mevalonate kinase